ncbi:hypothetical protein HYV70_01435 [Candidatus Uhrbacteria bacterium]|nr:hypothetical protein [Candidatus Uhrbacteria bacterium]
MKKSPEGFVPPIETTDVHDVPRATSVVERSHEAALLGESFEDASAALEQVERVIDVRKQLHARRFPTFYQVFEDIDAIHRSPFSQSEKEEEMVRLLDAAQERTSKFSPRVADLYSAVLCDLRGQTYQPIFEENEKKLIDLKESGDLDVLTSSTQPWEVKLNRLDTRLEGYLAGRRALDKREGNLMDDDTRAMRQEKLKNASNRVPGRRNESKPGMDEMERLKEGERAPALWSIFPAYGGYYREQSLSVWDASRNTWVEPSYEYSNVTFVPICKEEDPKKGLINFTMRPSMEANQWVSIPVPYTHGLSGIECKQPYIVQQDQNGDVVLFVEGEGKVDVVIKLSPVSDKAYGPFDRKSVEVPSMPAEFSQETLQEIERVRASKKSPLAKAKMLASYTKRHLQYSNNSSFNTIYDSDPKGYFHAIDTHKKADCDVANTYFAALCAQLDIPVRHVVGHSVKGKNEKGVSQITSGTGHAWSEVWDKTAGRWVKILWERVDATPAGDPNLEEGQQKSPSQQVPGDYGTQEAQSITDEQLEALRKKLTQRKEQLSYTKEERQLAEASGVELKEARQIVKEIAAAEDTRLPNGKRVVDVLSRLFNAIVESRKMAVEAYDGPVRKSEGGEGIQDIVRHKIGVVSGDSDPASREKIQMDEAIEISFGGMDVIFIGDKSGSMSSTANEEVLWAMQRRAQYLLFSALHRFDRALQQAGIPSDESLSVRTQGLSFRGSQEGELDEDKPLSGIFSPKDKVKLWHSMGNQGSGNGDVEALKHIYQQIKEEQVLEDKQTKSKKRLRLIVACSDGGPDDPVQVQQYAEALGQLGAVVVGVGLTDKALAVPEIYNTSYSRGDIARDINDLPAIVAKHLVAEAIRLFPDRARESARALIESVIAEFKRV